MHLKILSIGKAKMPYLQAGQEEFLPRLQPFAKCTVKELPLGEGPTAKEDEGNSILAEVKPGEYLIALDEHGTEFSSEGFSKFLAERMNRGDSKLCFVLGGHHGLSEAVRAKARTTMSLSPLTFPYQLARLVLIEQIYRAFSIIKGLPYHRA